MGNVRLTGEDRKIWSDPSYRDLVCIDNTDTWLMHQTVLLYHELVGKRVHVRSVLFQA
jgi:hypothetical protein